MKKLSTFLSVVFALAPYFLNAQSWQYVGVRDFTPGQAASPVIAISPAGTPYVLFSDGNYNRKATVMKFEGTAWSIVGTPGFSSAQAGGLSIATDNNGTPFICYAFTNFDSVAVKKFDGTNWVNVAPSGFTATDAHIARDGAGTVYLVYNDLGAANKVSVMKYNGSAWANVGAAGFSDSATGNTAIGFDGNNTPYVAYPDNGVAFKATVKQFDGTNWVTLGSRGVSPAKANNVFVAGTGTGTVYLAFGDDPNSNKSTVLKYTGSWAAAGPADFADVAPAAFGIDGNGSVYLGYSLNSTASITLTKFDGSTWNPVGPANFSPEIATGNFGFTIDNAGNPYVAFADFQNSQQAVVMKYGTATGIDNLVADENLSVYPNPAHGQFTIATKTGGDYLLVSTLGQQLETFHCKANSTNTFNTNNISQGLYYIINTENHTSAKIVVGL